LSHAKERQEKVCLNCNAGLHGRFCHHCGQENREPKESVWGLITHFFYDITHFDGKFFSTVKYLVLKPGFLPKEYITGRRASYLNPIRMYVFTSAFFFIIFFSIFTKDKININRNTTFQYGKDSVEYKRKDSISRENLKKLALRYVGTKEDSAEILEAFERAPDSMARKTVAKSPVKFSTSSSEYKSVREYDSLQKTLPKDKRDSWFAALMQKRKIHLKKTYGDDDTAMMKDWVNTFVHQFPKLLFVSLPLFALILHLLYIRRRKQFFYVSHGIFSIYLYIFGFIVLLVSFGLGYLSNATGWDVFDWLQLPLWLYVIYYNYKSMRVFYGQGTGKTLVKFLLLNILASITILILFVLFFILTAFQL